MVALGNSVVTLQVQGSVKDSILRRSVQGLQISPPFGEQSTKRATSIQGNGPCFRTARGSDLRVMSAIQVTPVPAADKVGGDLPEGYEFDDPTKKLLPRRAGILLHPTSLPGPYGVGELGAEAFKFIDWLDSTGCSVWQVHLLPEPALFSLWTPVWQMQLHLLSVCCSVVQSLSFSPGVLFRGDRH